jgi:chemotaxis signal transduction protein
VTEGRETLERRLAELKAAFDASFALPAEGSRVAQRGYLGIRLNDAPYALDLEEVAALRKHVPVTPVPSKEPHLLGVAGFAGTLTAVYDLTALFGQARLAEPVWFVLARGAPLAFAFQGMEGQLHVDAEDAEEAAATESGAASDLKWQAGLRRPVIRLGALVARLQGENADDRVEGAASK